MAEDITKIVIAILQLLILLMEPAMNKRPSTREWYGNGSSSAGTSLVSDHNTRQSVLSSYIG